MGEDSGGEVGGVDLGQPAGADPQLEGVIAALGEGMPAGGFVVGRLELDEAGDAMGARREE